MYPRAFLKNIFALLLFFSCQLSAQDSLKNLSITFSIVPGSRITVDGSTNVNLFSCFSENTVAHSPVLVTPSSSHTSATLEGAVIKTKTQTLDCANAAMNENLYDALHSESYPYIIVEITEVRSADGKPLSFTKGQDLVTKLNLTLAGRKKMNTVYLNVVNEGSGNYHFIGSHKITLSSYGIDPPKAFFGLVKVDDNITVQFNLVVHVEEKIPSQTN